MPFQRFNVLFGSAGGDRPIFDGAVSFCRAELSRQGIMIFVECLIFHIKFLFSAGAPGFGGQPMGRPLCPGVPVVNFFMPW